MWGPEWRSLRITWYWMNLGRTTLSRRSSPSKIRRPILILINKILCRRRPRRLRMEWKNSKYRRFYQSRNWLSMRKWVHWSIRSRCWIIRLYPVNRLSRKSRKYFRIDLNSRNWSNARSRKRRLNRNWMNSMINMDRDWLEWMNRNLNLLSGIEFYRISSRSRMKCLYLRRTTSRIRRNYLNWLFRRSNRSTNWNTNMKRKRFRIWRI